MSIERKRVSQPRFFQVSSGDFSLSIYSGRVYLSSSGACPLRTEFSDVFLSLLFAMNLICREKLIVVSAGL